MVEFNEDKHVERGVACKVCGNDFWYLNNPYQCVICKTERRKERYQKNREAEIEAAKQYQKDHPEVVKAILERRKELDPDYHQRWQQENPDKVAEYNRRYRERNRELINKRARERARTKRQAERLAQAEDR